MCTIIINHTFMIKEVLTKFKHKTMPAVRTNVKIKVFLELFH